MDFHELADRAARHHGIVTAEDFRAAGVPARTVQRWAGEGRLVRLHQGVFQMAGLPLSFEARLEAASRAAGVGAVVSHRAAAALWSLLPSAPVEVSVPESRRLRLHAVIVHRSSDLHLERLRVRSGLPVTDPMRTVIDCCAVLSPAAAAEVIEAGLTARLFSVAGLETSYDRLARPGRRGCGMVRRILDHRALGVEPADSELEVRMARLLRRAGLPVAVFQHEVRLRGRVARIDFAYPHLRIAIEVDGWKKFSSPDGAQHVLARQNALVVAGWTVLRFTWRDVVRRPEGVAADIATAVHFASAV